MQRALAMGRLRRARFLFICGRLIGFNKRGGKKRQKDFVMAGDGVAAGFFRFGFAVCFGCAGGGPLDDVLQRAIVLEKIEIRGSDGAQRRAEIARDGDGFQKNLGQNHRGAPIQIHTAGMHFADQRAK